jgi:hypothetical protein
MDSNSVRDFNYYQVLFVLFSDDSTPKFSDYRPVFFEGRAAWIQDTSNERHQQMPVHPGRGTDRTTATHPFTQFDERQQTVWTSARVC